MKRSIIFLSLLVFFSNCTNLKKELDIDLPFEGTKLVVFGLLCPTEPIAIRVTKTLAADKLSQSDTVAKASILLFENSIKIDSLVEGVNGWYHSKIDFRVKTGASYYVKVTALELPSVESEPEIVPNPIEISKATVLLTNIVNNRALLTYSFKDLADRNFYSLNEIYYYNSQRISNFQSDLNDAYPSFVNGYSDELFNGSEYTVTRQLTIGSLNISGTPAKRANRLLFSLFSMTEPFYDHLKSLMQYADDYGDPLTEIPGISTNVKGGYGFVSTCYKDTTWINLR